MKYTIFTATTLLVVTLLSSGSHAAPVPQPSESPRVICPGIVLDFSCGVPFTGP